MGDFFKTLVMVIFLLVVMTLVGNGLGFINLTFEGKRQNLETHITRQTNSYITTQQQALRNLKSNYDNLDSELSRNTDADIVNTLRSQQRGISRQMHEIADLIPGDVQPDIQAFLSNH